MAKVKNKRKSSNNPNTQSSQSHKKNNSKPKQQDAPEVSHHTSMTTNASKSASKSLKGRWHAVNIFVRRHEFTRECMDGFTTLQRRKFEREVYDYARRIGLSSLLAKKEVVKARKVCGEADYDSDATAMDGEVTEIAMLPDTGLAKKDSILPQSSEDLGEQKSLKQEAIETGSTRLTEIGNKVGHGDEDSFPKEKGKGEAKKTKSKKKQDVKKTDPAIPEGKEGKKKVVSTKHVSEHFAIEPSKENKKRKRQDSVSPTQILQREQPSKRLSKGGKLRRQRPKSPCDVPKASNSPNDHYHHEDQKGPQGMENASSFTGRNHYDAQDQLTLQAADRTEAERRAAYNIRNILSEALTEARSPQKLVGGSASEDSEDSGSEQEIRHEEEEAKQSSIGVASGSRDHATTGFWDGIRNKIASNQPGQSTRVNRSEDQGNSSSDTGSSESGESLRAVVSSMKKARQQQGLRSTDELSQKHEDRSLQIQQALYAKVSHEQSMKRVEEVDRLENTRSKLGGHVVKLESSSDELDSISSDDEGSPSPTKRRLTREPSSIKQEPKLAEAGPEPIATVKQSELNRERPINPHTPTRERFEDSDVVFQGSKSRQGSKRKDPIIIPDARSSDSESSDSAAANPPLRSASLQLGTGPNQSSSSQPANGLQSSPRHVATLSQRPNSLKKELAGKSDRSSFLKDLAKVNPPQEFRSVLQQAASKNPAKLSQPLASSNRSNIQGVLCATPITKELPCLEESSAPAKLGSKPGGIDYSALYKSLTEPKPSKAFQEQHKDNIEHLNSASNLTNSSSPSRSKTSKRKLKRSVQSQDYTVHDSQNSKATRPISQQVESTGFLTPFQAPPTPSRRKATPHTSTFFSPKNSPHKPAIKSSCLKFPPLSAPVFGLVQERLAIAPFKLLVATIFLTKTKGTAAIPTFDSLFEVYPSPESFASAQPNDLVPFIRSLGLQNKRAEAIVKLAKAWVKTPPTFGRRYRKLKYPHPGDGKDLANDHQPIADNDIRMAWEIAHLPVVGAYALDSWRIFCRDRLRNVPSDMTAARTAFDKMIELNQEWTRVLPMDKELRAYLKWRWLRLGLMWDPLTGDVEQIDPGIIQSMQMGITKEWKGWKSPWDVEVIKTVERRCSDGDTIAEKTDDTQVGGVNSFNTQELEQVIDETIELLPSEKEIFNISEEKR